MSPTHTPADNSPPDKQFKSLLLLAGVLGISLTATYAAWRNTRQEALQELHSTFNFQVYDLSNRIKHRMDTYEQVLRGTRGLFAASDVVERREFKTYVETLQLKEEYPGIQGVGFSLIVPKAKKQQHIGWIRSQGFPQYSIKPAGERETYTAIIYLEPFKERNLRAFGYDMYSEPLRRKAMERARDLNQAAITGKVKLLQENLEKIQAGFLMYLPIYDNGLPHQSLNERRTNIIGWVYEPFRMNDFMDGLSASLLSDIKIEIYDNENQLEQAKMFDSDNLPDSCTQLKPKLHRTERIELNGTVWTMSVCSTPAFEASVDNQKPQIIAITGGFLSLLLSVIVWQLLSSRSRALAVATKSTRELGESELRFQMMADSAPVLIWISGLDGLCFWFNKIWLKFTGRSMEQESGNGWAEGVHPEDLQRCIDYYLSHFQRHEAFRMEYRLKRHDGKYRWILDSGVPRFDNEGNFSGFIGSCIDITELKRTEAALLSSNADLTRFAEVSAHHLMEPTRRLTSYTQRLDKLLTPVLPAQTAEEINSCLGYLQSDANRLHTMVHDIQLYLAAAEPRGVLQLEDANDILAQIQKRLQARLTALNAIILTQNLPPAFLDRPRLVDLFTLIIDNALCHGRPATADLTAQIVISGERVGKLSRYAITDNGSGIPAEYQERVFEIFERLGHNSEAGSGIGLAIARRIIENRHGKIWIENSPQPGTTVMFELPDGE